MEIEVIDLGDNHVTVSDLEKDGRGDTHMSEDARMNKSGEWKWVSTDYNSFVTYHGENLAKAILDMLNKNGVPTDDNV